MTSRRRPEDGGEKAEVKYLKDTVYDQIKTKIIECEYPPDSILTEARLMEDTGVSRTPIREAINRLAHENLVMVIPKKGILVKEITIRDIIQVFETREIIEPELMREYGDRLNKVMIREFVQACKTEEQIERKINLDERFHRMLYDVCGNRYLKELLLMLEGHNHRNRVWRSNEARVNDSQKEHIAIAEAVLQDDYEQAARLLKEHLANAKEYAMKKYL